MGTGILPQNRPARSLFLEFENKSLVQLGLPSFSQLNPKPTAQTDRCPADLFE